MIHCGYITTTGKKITYNIYTMLGDTLYVLQGDFELLKAAYLLFSDPIFHSLYFKPFLRR